MEKCIGCELCAGVCPADCIYVRGLDNPPDDPVSPGERYGFVYEINYLRCIHCDLCVEACPTEAITESKLFEFSFTNRADAIYTKGELLVDDDGRPQQLPWEDWREGDDLHTSGWMRATSPSGERRLRGPGAVVGRARLRRPGARGRPVGAPRRRGHRAACRCARSSSPTCSTRTSRSSDRGMRGRMLAAPGDARSSSASADVRRSSDRRGLATGPPRQLPLSTARAAPGASRRRRSPHDGPARRHGRHHHPRPAHLRHRRRRDPRRRRSGVVTSRNPVHAALILVMTLFGVAVLFVEQQANFLAAVQVIVYAGRHRRPVPVRDHVPRRRPAGEHRGRAARGQRPLALSLVAARPGRRPRPRVDAHWATGAHAVAGPDHRPGQRRGQLGRSVFTTYLFAFEVTAGAARDRRGRRGGAGPPARPPDARRRAGRDAGPRRPTGGELEPARDGDRSAGRADAPGQSGRHGGRRATRPRVGGRRTGEEVAP